MVCFELRQKALMACSCYGGSCWEITYVVNRCHGIFSRYIQLRSRSLHAQLSLSSVEHVNVWLKCTASNALLLLFNCWLVKCFIHIHILFTSPPACSAKCKTMITVLLWVFNVNPILFLCWNNNVPPWGFMFHMRSKRTVRTCLVRWFPSLAWF